MLLIVAHHFVVNSGVLDVMYKNPLSANSVFLFFIWCLGEDRYKLLHAYHWILHVQTEYYTEEVCKTDK